MSWLSLARCSEGSCSSGMELGLLVLIKSICCPQPLGCFKLLKVGPGHLGRGCLGNEAANPIPEGSEHFEQFMGLFSCQAWRPNFPSCHRKGGRSIFWDAPGAVFTIRSPPRALTLCLLSPGVLQALLKMDCQGLVVRLIQDFVLLTTAVEVAQRWRELAEKLAKVSKQQMDAYEAPHRDKTGTVDSEVRAGTAGPAGPWSPSRWERPLGYPAVEPNPPG